MVFFEEDSLDLIYMVDGMSVLPKVLPWRFEFKVVDAKKGLASCSHTLREEKTNSNSLHQFLWDRAKIGEAIDTIRHDWLRKSTRKVWHMEKNNDLVKISFVM